MKNYNCNSFTWYSDSDFCKHTNNLEQCKDQWQLSNHPTHAFETIHFVHTRRAVVISIKSPIIKCYSPFSTKRNILLCTAILTRNILFMKPTNLELVTRFISSFSAVFPTLLASLTCDPVTEPGAPYQTIEIKTQWDFAAIFTHRSLKQTNGFYRNSAGPWDMNTEGRAEEEARKPPCWCSNEFCFFFFLLIYFFWAKFLLDQGSFCATCGILCFEFGWLWVDSSLMALFCHLCVTIYIPS